MKPPLEASKKAKRNSVHNTDGSYKLHRRGQNKKTNNYNFRANEIGKVGGNWASRAEISMVRQPEPS